MLGKEELLRGKIPGEETGIQVKTGLCGFCGGSCLVDVYCKEGKVIKVEGSRRHPSANGHICVKGAALKQALYSPKRLLYPMKRVGRRGEDKFQRISWEEALALAAEKLECSRQAHGVRSSFFYVGHPKWFRKQATDLANAFGTPNFGTESSTCAYAVMMAFQTVFGKDVKMPPVDWKRCRALCIWGGNPLHSNPVSTGAQLLGALDRGAKLIVVDPRNTPTSERALLHLRPFPGTDGALALGMAHVILAEGLENREYIEKYTQGFEEYREYVKDFPPEKVEQITGVPKEEIVAAARLMGREAPCPIQVSAAPLVHNINGVQNVRAVAMLMALTGSFGVEGGSMPPGPGRAMLLDTMMAPERQRICPEEDLSHAQFPAWARLMSHEVQAVRLADYILGKGEYPIKTLVAFGMNHHMWPRPDRLEKAFEELDFFVNTDMYWTDTCRYADLLLPAQTSLEREQLEILGRDTVFYQGHIAEPMGEARTDVEILAGLAEKLGLQVGKDHPIHTQEEFLRHSLSPTGLTLEEVKAAPMGVPARKTLPPRTSQQILQAKTPSGKIEFVSSVLASCQKPGHDGLPVYRDYREKLPLAEYPLILSTGSRKPQLFHSRTYRLPWLARLEDYPLVEVHPKDARACGVRDGEIAAVVTPVGSMDFLLLENGGVREGTVNIYHGAGEKDINYLMDDTYLDPISGFPGFKSYCCRIEKKEVSHE